MPSMVTLMKEILDSSDFVNAIAKAVEKKLQDIMFELNGQEQRMGTIESSRPKEHDKPEWTVQVRESYRDAALVWKCWENAGKPIVVPLHDNNLRLKKEFRRRLRQSQAEEH